MKQKRIEAIGDDVFEKVGKIYRPANYIRWKLDVVTSRTCSSRDVFTLRYSRRLRFLFKRINAERLELEA
jgi:hypothetical protein